MGRNNFYPTGRRPGRRDGRPHRMPNFPNSSDDRPEGESPRDWRLPSRDELLRLTQEQQFERLRPWLRGDDDLDDDQLGSDADADAGYDDGTYVDLIIGDRMFTVAADDHELIDELQQVERAIAATAGDSDFHDMSDHRTWSVADWVQVADGAPHNPKLHSTKRCLFDGHIDRLLGRLLNNEEGAR